MNGHDEYIEPDAPWFDPEWLMDHFDTFPLDSRLAIEQDGKAEER